MCVRNCHPGIMDDGSRFHLLMLPIVYIARTLVEEQDVQPTISPVVERTDHPDCLRAVYPLRLQGVELFHELWICVTGCRGRKDRQMESQTHTPHTHTHMQVEFNKA